MRVFISWSGEKSRRAAESLEELIAFCLAPVATFLSSTTRGAGVPWREDLERQLKAADIGVVCLASDGLESPWIGFEAGVLIGASKPVVPYLVDVDVTAMPDPLRGLQAARSSDAAGKLVHTIAQQLNLQLRQDILDERIRAFSGRNRENGMGLEAVYPTRAEALAAFEPFVEAEIASRSGRLWVVGSSLQGFIQGNGRSTNILALIKRARSAMLDVRVLLTDPGHSLHREKLEERGRGDIASEIERTIANLEQVGLERDRIGLYPGPPTVSLFATSKFMVLNPYPYGLSARSSFSLLVRAGEAGGIYEQYILNHCEKGWTAALLLDQSAHDERVVGCGWHDEKEEELPMRKAHTTGAPHRAVHIEVWKANDVLVWQRRDGRWELPGGHVRWRDHRAEDRKRAAARELLEESGLIDTLSPSENRKVSDALEEHATYFNQSQSGRNNEWVTVFRIDAEKLPVEIDLSAIDGRGEGNQNARYLSVAQIQNLGKEPLQLASSLRAFLTRTPRSAPHRRNGARRRRARRQHR